MLYQEASLPVSRDAEKLEHMAKNIPSLHCSQHMIQRIKKIIIVIIRLYLIGYSRLLVKAEIKEMSPSCLLVAFYRATM